MFVVQNAGVCLGRILEKASWLGSNFSFSLETVAGNNNTNHTISTARADSSKRDMVTHSSLRLCILHHSPLRCTSALHSVPRQAVRRYAVFRPRRSRLSKTVIGTSVLILGTVGYLYATDTRASVHQWLAIPLVRALYPDAEDAHEAGTHALRSLWNWRLHPRERGGADEDGKLRIEVFGHVLDNPLGISAGLDKHGDIPDSLFALGPAIVEIGGITPRPQEGNPKPRVFRLPSQEGIINRYGLNSDGAEAVAAKLQGRVRRYAHDHRLGENAEDFVLNGGAGVPPGSLLHGKLLAVQVAKQETTHADDIEAIRDDYVFGTKTLAKFADIIVVNVSCPNAPGYRELQQAEPLTKILSGVVAAAKAVDRYAKPAVMVKVSPDEDSDDQVSSICQAVWASGVEGVIVGNTTKRKVDLLEHSQPSAAETNVFSEAGGYSGPQLFPQTVKLVAKYRRMLDQGMYASNNESQGSSKEPTPDPAKEKIIFCTGGIRSGKEALEVLNAGASVAQIYTAMVYGGVGQITRMKNEMRNEMLGK